MNKFKIAENNRKTCSLCYNKIKKGMKYIAIGYKNNYGRWCEKRICEVCIWLLSKQINPEEIKEELNRRIIGEL